MVLRAGYSGVTVERGNASRYTVAYSGLLYTSRRSHSKSIRCECLEPPSQRRQVVEANTQTQPGTRPSHRREWVMGKLGRDPQDTASTDLPESGACNYFKSRDAPVIDPFVHTVRRACAWLGRLNILATTSERLDIPREGVDLHSEDLCMPSAQKRNGQ